MFIIELVKYDRVVQTSALRSAYPYTGYPLTSSNAVACNLVNRNIPLDKRVRTVTTVMNTEVYVSCNYFTRNVSF